MNPFQRCLLIGEVGCSKLAEEPKAACGFRRGCDAITGCMSSVTLEGEDNPRYNYW